MMISLIIKSYLSILLAIGIGSVTLFLLGLFWIYKSMQTSENDGEGEEDDISAIAGDDVLSTQLDLARAYIETNRKPLAKKILQYVAQQGSADQQEEAHRLLSYL